MILYHGSYKDFQTIDLKLCQPYKDFGQGFYLTDIREQAEKMAVKKALLYNGTPIVLQYEFNDDFLSNDTLKVKRFPSPNREWAEFIYKNRSRTEHFHHNYDIVTGPIANDGVAYLLDRYEEGSLSLDELAKELEFRELNNQYYFGTEKSLNFLKRI
ncbi:MAG: DUF3990 domain-containing protein [Bacteroidales bacterium]|nr:DUF3990 domain-containing protein [Bacteroidales bacterium]